MAGLGYRYSTPPDPPGYPTPGTPSRYHPDLTASWYGSAPRLNSAVGLNTVGQLSLSTHFSGFIGMTEVYNLAVAGILINH